MLFRSHGDRITLRAGREAAIYLLNKKRAELAEIEERYGVTVEVMIDEAFEGARMTVESSGPKPVNAPRIAPPIIEEDEDEDDYVADEDEEDDDDREEREERGGRDDRGDREDRGDGRGKRRRLRLVTRKVLPQECLHLTPSPSMLNAEC